MPPRQDRLDRRRIYRRTRESPVQIDQMYPFAARVLKCPRLRRRVVAENGGRVHFSMDQAYGLSVLQVDCGI